MTPLPTPLPASLVERCWSRMVAQRGDQLPNLLTVGQHKLFMGYVIEAFVSEQAVNLLEAQR